MLYEKSLLLYEESKSSINSIAGVRDDDFKYHVKKMEEEGLIKADIMINHEGGTQIPALAMAEELTWDGHELFDLMKDKPLWEKAKTIIAEKSESISFSVLIEVLSNLLNKAVGT
jgi:hypothetical protein